MGGGGKGALKPEKQSLGWHLVASCVYNNHELPNNARHVDSSSEQKNK